MIKLIDVDAFIKDYSANPAKIILWGKRNNKALGWVRDDFIKGEAVIVPADKEAPK